MKKTLLLILFISLGFNSQAQEQTITTSDGVELYVKIAGKGTPCLYIHGGPNSGSYWFEKFFGDFMEQHFTMIYLDQRGVGRSTSPEDGNYSLDRMAKDYEEVRKTLGFEKWLTIGHSFAGLLQMGYVERYPQSHLGMMMIDCTLNIKQSFCDSWSPRASEFLGEDYPGCDKDSISVMERMGYLGDKLREKGLFWKMGFSNESNEEALDATYEKFDNFNYDFGNAVFSIEDYWKNFKPDTKNIQVPVLYYIGTEDYMVGPEHYKGINFPHMMLVREQGGHMPMIEHKPELEKAILRYKKKFRV